MAKKLLTEEEMAIILEGLREKRALSNLENMGFYKPSITNSVSGFSKVSKNAWKTERNPGKAARRKNRTA